MFIMWCCMETRRKQRNHKLALQTFCLTWTIFLSNKSLQFQYKMNHSIIHGCYDSPSRHLHCPTQLTNPPVVERVFVPPDVKWRGHTERGGGVRSVAMEIRQGASRWLLFAERAPLDRVAGPVCDGNVLAVLLVISKQEVGEIVHLQTHTEKCLHNDLMANDNVYII